MIALTKVVWPAQCPWKAKDMCGCFRRHCFPNINEDFFCRPTGREYHPTKDLLPLFSQSKINECHADITFPTYYGWDSLLSQEQQKQLLPWDEREDTLFFRGSTTGKPPRVPEREYPNHDMPGSMHMRMDIMCILPGNVPQLYDMVWPSIYQGWLFDQFFSVNYRYVTSVDNMSICDKNVDSTLQAANLKPIRTIQ